MDRDAGIVGIGTCFLGIENCYSDYTVVRAPHDRGDKVKNSYYLTTPPWPGTDLGNEECYFGTQTDADTLKEEFYILGGAYQAGLVFYSQQQGELFVTEQARQIIEHFS